MPFLRFASLPCLLFCSLGAVACGASAEGGPPSDPGSGDRAISEADIIQLDNEVLYAMSKSGSVSIVDVSKPKALTLLGQARIKGEPFEMYRRGDDLVVMSNGAVTSSGAALSDPASIDRASGAVVSVLDVHDPKAITEKATFPITGEIADSRFVGDVLYLATFENAQCYQCGTQPRTLVTSFDFADPTAMRQVNQVSFASNAPDSYNLAWGTNWKRSLFVTDERLYIGGHADIDFSAGDDASPEGIIDVLDIGDPTGKLMTLGRITVAGAVLSRWQIDERDGILRVISQKGAGRTGNGLAMPEVATFEITDGQTFEPLATRSLKLPSQEGLRTVRFDGDRAYAITYNQTDPLFTIDLSDPTNPRQRGALEMPGFMFHLEPRGDRVIGLGIDRADSGGSLNVSLFDVSDMDKPKMLQRVPFASSSFAEDFEILNGELPEDQDRIQKAFKVYDDGLVVVPFSSGEACNDADSGVEVIDWKNDDTLAERAFLPLPGNPRRAIEHQAGLLTVSDSNVRNFSFEGRGAAQQTSDLVIGSCVQKSLYGDGGYGYDDYYGCSIRRSNRMGERSSPSRDVGWFAAALAALGFVVARQRRGAR